MARKLTGKARNDFHHEMSNARVFVRNAREARQLGACRLAADLVVKASMHRRAAFAVFAR
jgi:hypothetical protein